MIINGEASDDKSSSYDLFYIIKLYLSQMCLHQPLMFEFQGDGLFHLDSSVCLCGFNNRMIPDPVFLNVSLSFQ